MKNGVRPRVLVIDDDGFVREIVSTILKRLGCDVLQAEDGEAAYEVFERSRPSLVISDIVMPRMSGLELCKRIRDEGFATPVLLLTNCDDVPHAVRAALSGATEFLLKPVNPDRLSERLGALVGAWLGAPA